MIEPASRPGLAPAAAGHAPRARVLLVEDQPALRRAYARILAGAAYEVVQATDGRSAIHALEADPFDAILTDISMPGMSGTQLLRAVRERHHDVPVLLITANPTVDTAVDAVELGALRYLIKPIAPDDLLASVDRAITLSLIARVKRESVAYLASVDQLVHDRPRREAVLRDALASLWMAYQPIVDVGRREIIAYEALVRSDAPGCPDPGALFALAEELGLVGEVGRAIRAAVARTLRDGPPRVDVFVNVHPKDLLDDALYAADDPLAPFAERIVLEVTEREAIDEAGMSARASRLRGRGYRLAIDDLGAGYAGLNYFAQLTPDVVKIDMSLVRNIHREAIKQKLVGSLAGLCRDLGMLVVVEGVETAEERAALTALGCDVQQGFLFARPGRPFPTVDW